MRLTTFNKYMCNWTLEVRDVLKILWKRGEIRDKRVPDSESQLYMFSLHKLKSAPRLTYEQAKAATDRKLTTTIYWRSAQVSF